MTQAAKWDQYEFRLGSWWATAIINGDYSGLSDQETAQLDQWIASQELPNGHWDGFDEEKDSLGFSRDDITGMAGDCYRVRYHFQTA